jgi:anti-sigma factor RsiW
MPEIDERTERLINRKLDGEITPDEELELNKILIRSPATRALLERSAGYDELARAALRQELGEYTPPRLEVVAGGALPVPRVARRRSWWSGVSGGALAACLVLIASVWQPALRPGGNRDGAAPHLAGNVALAEPPRVGGDEMQTLPEYLEVPRRQRQAVDRSFIGVYDKRTNRYFVLEVRHVRTQTTVVKGDM